MTGTVKVEQRSFLQDDYLEFTKRIAQKISYIGRLPLWEYVDGYTADVLEQCSLKWMGELRAAWMER